MSHPIQRKVFIDQNSLSEHNRKIALSTSRMVCPRHKTKAMVRQALKQKFSTPNLHSVGVNQVDVCKGARVLGRRQPRAETRPPARNSNTAQYNELS